MNDLEEIKKCVRDLDLFLSKIERDYNLKISLHTAGAFLEFLRDDQTHNSHEIHYCQIVKSDKNRYKKCKKMQEIVISSFDRSREPRRGCCVFGVEEYVVPAFSHGKAIGFFSVSGYSPDREATRKRAKKMIGELTPEVEYAISELKSDFPDEWTLKCLLSPAADLLGMIHFHLSRGNKMSDLTFSTITSYISNHFAEPLTVRDLARVANCSESFINHTFKRKNGCSFSTYLNSQRVARAKTLLVETTGSVSEIAFQVGFNDANYFSSVFKKELGLTPLEFRKKFLK